MAEEVMEDFGPSRGRITGVLGVAICVGIVVLGVAESARGFPPAAVWASPPRPTTPASAGCCRPSSRCGGWGA